MLGADMAVAQALVFFLYQHDDASRAFGEALPHKEHSITGKVRPDLRPDFGIRLLSFI